MSLRFAVLGTPAAWRGDRPVELGPPQRQALLLGLLLRQGRSASMSELIDGTWGEAPPPSSVGAVRTAVSHLRKVLEPARDAKPAVLVSQGGGYALRLPDDAVDAAVFEELLDRAGREGPQDARRTLGRALKLWTGEALSGVPGPFAEMHRNRLAERRLMAVEWRLRLDLDTGEHAPAVGELTALVAQHPLRERLRALLMEALYGTGRQAEALAVYAEVRRLLDEEMGVEPSPELSDLHLRILRADPALAARRPAAVVVTSPAPTWLPAVPAAFTGREPAAATLRAALSVPKHATALVILSGASGVGKTSLAVSVAHELAPQFEDGRLFAELSDMTDVAGVLGSFLDALGVEAGRQPDGEPERMAMLRSLLSGRRVLIVLDNARDAAQVMALLPATAGSAVLATSRATLVGLPSARHVSLDVMTQGEAVDLLSAVLGAGRVLAERQAAEQLAGLCGHLPLALRIVASRLAVRPAWTIGAMVDRLADERRRLTELRAGSDTVEASFDLAYRQLDGAQARAFRLLALPDGPDLSLAAAAAVLDVGEQEAEGLAEGLVDLNMVESPAPGRYRFHDLLRLYARGLAGEPEPWLARLLGFYLATGQAGYATVNPLQALTTLLQRPTRGGLAFDGKQAAREWFTTEQPAVLAAAMQATGDLVATAADVLLTFPESGSTPAARVFTAGERIAAAAPDARVESRARFFLGLAYWDAGRPAEGYAQLGRAVALADSVQDPVAAYSKHMLGLDRIRFGDMDEAEHVLTEAIEGLRQVGERHWLVYAGSSLARVWSSQDMAAEVLAWVNANRDMELTRLDPDLAVEMAFSRGDRLLDLGRHVQAMAELEAAFTGFRQAGNHRLACSTRQRLAEVLLALGRPAEAVRHAELAYAQVREMDLSLHSGRLATVLGQALAALGQHDRARTCWQEALDTLTPLGEQHWAARARSLLDGIDREHLQAATATLPGQEGERPHTAMIDTE
ncbi:BTAD domain-containing putative transcriptional regulator [Nonomuraea sp. NPDC050556]|uniref:AfsR/SARP family transcriptional regulator n=1 Tax=Nonomuraea sp. NPDC050556 TaxID=3364369 RepID=UPI003791D535